MEKVYFQAGYTRPGSRCSSSGLLIRILVAAFVLITSLLIVVAIALILTQSPIEFDEKPTNETVIDTSTTSAAIFRKRKPTYQKFTFDQLFSGKLFLKDGYEFSWTPDGDLLRKKDEYFGIFKTSSVVVKTPSNTFESVDYLDDFDYMRTLSSNQKYAYRYRITREMFRYSTERVYEIVKIENGTVSQVSWPLGPGSNTTIQAFYWNPKKDSNDLVFVHNYNLYYQSDPENPSTAVQLTTDGEHFYRYGVSNWLYEEEILDSNQAFWWSDSGRYISYLRFDDRLVNRVFIPTYANGDPYVQYSELPYPKAGVFHNTAVAQFIWDREKNKIVEAVAPDELRADNQSYYVMRNNWMTMPEELKELGKERLVTVWSNREQNRIYYTLCSEVDCLLTLTQPFSINGKTMWAEPKEVGAVTPTNTGFFTILPHVHKDGNIYNHIAHIEIETSGSGKITKWIGRDFDIMNIHGYFTEKDMLVFSAYGNEIGTHNLYRVQKATVKRSKELVTMLNSQVENCEHGSYSVDPTGKRATMMCHVPFDNTRFHLIDIDAPKNSIILEGDEEARLPFDKLNRTFGKTKLTSGIDGHYALYTPPVLRAGEKIPLILDLYGGPNSKKVQKTTPPAQFIQIGSQFEVAFAHVDVSGSAGRGWNVKEPVYKKLGQNEAAETIEMIKYLTEAYPFLDPDNVVVMGWSYGGFLSAQIAVKDQGQRVKCAISIAPVTDFQYYDTAYTERYMGLPSENPVGYNMTNLIPSARNMANVKYMLAHGEKDDNVHYQNSARWSEALQNANIHFTQLVYANEAHSLSSKTKHLYAEVQRFLTEECFNSPKLTFVDHDDEIF